MPALPLWIRRLGTLSLWGSVLLHSFLLHAEHQASEGEIAELMERCHPHAFTTMAAALPFPERRYSASEPSPQLSLPETALRTLSTLPELMREQFFRRFDFSQLLQVKKLRLDLAPGEFEQLQRDNKNKRNAEHLLFWYPHRDNGFTHPLHFERGRPFQFIVHAVNDWGKGLQLMEHPERIVNLDLSTSLIDQDNMVTYSSSGFILEVHPNLIYANSPHNMARNDEHPSTMNHFFPISEPRELLQKSKGQMNEVVIAGSEGGQAVKIIGIFMHARRDGRPWPVFSQRRITRLRELCTQLQLPVVGLPVSDF